MHWTRALVSLAIISSAALFSCGHRSGTPSPSRAEGVAAFQSASAVLLHPRCLNCHARGDAPLQGDDQHLHIMNVMRSSDGKGTPAMRCTNCHQAANSPLPHSPPGADDWHMPGPDNPMTWQGLTLSELCESLKDPARNGHRSMENVIDHLETPLVKWAWEPGGDRARPPLQYEEFVAKMRTWKEAGAPCPGQ